MPNSRQIWQLKSSFSHSGFEIVISNRRNLYGTGTLTKSCPDTGKGHIGETGYYYGSNEKPIILNFDLYGFVPVSFSDLIELNDTIIDLTNPLCKVSLTLDTVRCNLTLLNGSLNFKRAQNQMVDKQQYEIILSGVFDFQALINDEPTSITMGRFDLGIANDNFFKY